MATILFLFSFCRGCSFVHGRQMRINDVNTVKWHTHTHRHQIELHFYAFFLLDTRRYLDSLTDFISAVRGIGPIHWLIAFSGCHNRSEYCGCHTKMGHHWNHFTNWNHFMISTSDVINRHRENELFSTQTHFHTSDSFILSFRSWCSAVSLAICR